MKHYGAIRFPCARWYDNTINARLSVASNRSWNIDISRSKKLPFMSSRQLLETVSSAFTVSRETSLIVDPIQGSGPIDITWYYRLAVVLNHTSRYPVSLHSLILWEDCFETSWLRHDRILSVSVALNGITSYKRSLTVIKHRVRMYSFPQILLLACLHRFTWNIHRIDSITWVALLTAISETSISWLCYICLILIVLLKSGVSI